MIENTVQDVKEFNQSHWNVIWQSYWIHIYAAFESENVRLFIHVIEIITMQIMYNSY